MFILTLALGIIAVAAIAASPLYADRIRPVGSARLSTAAVSLALAIPLFGAASPRMGGIRSELFLCSFVLILIAAVLAPRGEDPDEPPYRGDDDPPWWPEFERGFRSYARRRRPPVSTR